MIAGEWKKIIRNCIFVVVMLSIMIANVITILYSNEKENEYYLEYKNTLQQEYCETYTDFIDGMEERARLLLQTHGKTASAFYKRNIEKTQKDYASLTGVKLDMEYNVGMEKYAEYSYGIFFVIAFAFTCLEYVFFSEKRTGLIYMLRTATKGRRELIHAKLFVYMTLCCFFVLMQEFITLFCFERLYSLGNLAAPIQSLAIFRDCVFRITMREGLFVIMLQRIMMALVMAALIFFGALIQSYIVPAVMISSSILGIQYICYQVIPVNSSFDKFCCLNVFYLWDIKKFIGVYHNLNFFGYPVEKNIAMDVISILFIVVALIIGPLFFAVGYQEKTGQYEWKLFKRFRYLGSSMLHQGSLLLNEVYKLVFLQKKWIVVVIFCCVIINSYNKYVPSTAYQTAYEATYHMYLHQIEGRLDEDAEHFILEEKENVSALEDELEQALESGEEIKYMQLQKEYESREQAFERLWMQYERLKAEDGKVYLLDEINYKSLILNYDRDIVIFLMGEVSLILLISGIFASEQENKVTGLSNSTKNGRAKLFQSKRCTAKILTFFIFLLAEIPRINGYKNVLPYECGAQKLCCLFDPYVCSSITIMGLALLITGMRFLLYAGIGAATMFMAVKSKNEFMTIIIISAIVIVGCLIFYFGGTSLTLIIIHMLGG